ncbi:MAG TPA: hypothetical protein VM369_04935 [Candidatus Binatia bacterium]|nr:hypothetical protein [Candidatus Binatia bacterium]
MNGWLHFVATSAALGVAMEMGAAAGRLWAYTPPRNVIGNVVAMVGLVFGTLAWLTRGSPALQVLCGAAIGIAYEAANFAWLHAWTFPGGRCLFLRGRTQLTLGIGAAWGVYPVLTNLAVSRW